ncbi:hypothetical protein ACQUSR_00605 [Streptomyces sp. P1-3]|uniref:hypothetical protein n=1 Tax=Streptomyces sp. P1-3 TaxID=3421658 RepID=UPI003D366647
MWWKLAGGIAVLSLTVTGVWLWSTDGNGSKSAAHDSGGSGTGSSTTSPSPSQSATSTGTPAPDSYSLAFQNKPFDLSFFKDPLKTAYYNLDEAPRRADQWNDSSYVATEEVELAVDYWRLTRKTSFGKSTGTTPQECAAAAKKNALPELMGPEDLKVPIYAAELTLWRPE